MTIFVWNFSFIKSEWVTCIKRLKPWEREMVENFQTQLDISLGGQQLPCSAFNDQNTCTRDFGRPLSGRKSGIHHICDAGCTFSREEISRQPEADKGKKEKLFNHTWLCKAYIAYCAASGYWWPVIIRVEGVYYILCTKHNV